MGRGYGDDDEAKIDDENDANGKLELKLEEAHLVPSRGPMSLTTTDDDGTKFYM
jgi:hypothetical protein